MTEHGHSAEEVRDRIGAPPGRGVLRDVVYGDRPAPEAGPTALARRIDALLARPDLRRACGQTARDRIAARHLAGAATEIIWGALTPLLEART